MTQTVHKSHTHDSARLAVMGIAEFTDDMPFPEDGLHIALGQSAQAHARIKKMNLDKVRRAAGVVAVLTADDIPGVNDASAIFGDDPVFATDKVEYHGQCVFAVVAVSAKAARAAALLAEIDYAPLPAIFTIKHALAKNNLLQKPEVIERGDLAAGFAKSKNRLQGAITMGGQEHFSLESHAALAIASEGDAIQLYSSTQNPTEVQHKVAEALGVPMSRITVTIRRMGGGFGSRESQGNLPAIIAAIAARKTGRVCKIMYDRDEDMRVTGKRHDFFIRYDVGFDDDGRIHAMDVDHALRCGMSYDLSLPIAGKALLQADNTYYIEAIKITSRLCKTNTPSNTAFRGFGAPQANMGMERIIEEVAAALGMDSVAVRRKNYYADYGDAHAGQITQYHQPVRDCIINAMTDELCRTSNYLARKKEIEKHNTGTSPFIRGIGFAPVKFGISFERTALNQAGALVHVYKDGSVQLNHGGTEMGQGLHTKIAQVCAEVFGLDLERIRITATSTGKVPNTSATAASSGTDLNGMAARRAAATIRKRMAEYLGTLYQRDAADVGFADNHVHIGEECMPFQNAVALCYEGRVALSATGHYATPDIHWDPEKKRGSPMFYFAYGAAVSEVIVDRLTGESRLIRADILHDVGRSINPAIDRGQIEGAFVQGVGWLTTEELVYDAEDGRLLTHAPSTYKIPACSDRPHILNIALYDDGGARSDTIHKSKAVGEPPLLLAISAYNAICHAVSAINGKFTRLDAPLTAERVLTGIKK